MYVCMYVYIYAQISSLFKRVCSKGDWNTRIFVVFCFRLLACALCFNARATWTNIQPQWDESFFFLQNKRWVSQSEFFLIVFLSQAIISVTSTSKTSSESFFYCRIACVVFSLWCMCAYADVLVSKTSGDYSLRRLCVCCFLALVYVCICSCTGIINSEWLFLKATLCVLFSYVDECVHMWHMLRHFSHSIGPKWVSKHLRICMNIYIYIYIYIYIICTYRSYIHTRTHTYIHT